MTESSMSPEGSLQPPVQFFYVEHIGIENASALGQRLQDYDVVALEYVIGADSRAEAQELANQITHATTEAEAERLLEAKDRYFSYDRFKHTLMMSLVGTKKDIVLVDANREDVPEMEVMREEMKAQEKAITTQPTHVVMGHAKRILLAVAAMDVRREHLVAKQVEALVDGLEPGKKLAVFQGAAHTPTYHELKRSGMNVHRDFIYGKKPDGNHPQVRQSYTLVSTLLRQITMHPDKPVSEDMWARHLLIDYATYATWDQTYEESRPFVETVENAIQQVGEPTLNKLLEAVDSIRLETHPETEENISLFRKGLKKLFDEELLDTAA